jgi:hypothetical protein
MFLLAYQRPPTCEEEDAVVRFLAARADHLAPERLASPPAPAWRYGTGTLDCSPRRVVAFQEFGYWTGEQWQPGPSYPDVQSGLLALTRTGGHPGIHRGQAAIRRWVAPSAGTVHISGALRHGGSEGDGVEGTIVSSRQGFLGSWVVRQGEAKTEIQGVQIQAGDLIDFVVDGRFDPRSDGFEWAPRITMGTTVKLEKVSGQVSGGGTRRWDAAEDYAGPPAEPFRPLSVWDELGLTLLLSNEFVFID